jgi:hypothetical protein
MAGLEEPETLEQLQMVKVTFDRYGVLDSSIQYGTNERYRNQGYQHQIISSNVQYLDTYLQL